MSNIWENIDKDQEIEEIAHRILTEIEGGVKTSATKPSFTKSISQLSDIDYVKRMLKNIDLAHTKPVCTIEKIDVIKGLILVSWLQRIYSTIRSLLLGIVAAVVLIPVLLFFGSLNIVQNIMLAIPIFVTGLIITRLLDQQIIQATRKTVKYLATRKKLRNFIMNNF